MGAYVCTCDIRCEAHPGNPSADELQDRIDATSTYLRQVLATIIDDPIPAERVGAILAITMRRLQGDSPAGSTP